MSTNKENKLANFLQNNMFNSKGNVTIVKASHLICFLKGIAPGFILFLMWYY